MDVDAALGQAFFCQLAVGTIGAERQHLLVAHNRSGFILEAKDMHVALQQQRP